MANIRVTCPTCGKVLEVGAEHAGEEVECGECFQVFVAEGPPKSRSNSDERDSSSPRTRGKPRPRRRDDDDEYDHDRRQNGHDDDDYEPPRRRGGGGGGGGEVASGTAVVGLLVGILALLTSCCPLTGIGFGILAMVLGSIGKKYPGSAGAGAAATVLGSIAFVISAGVIVWLVARA